MHWRNAAAALKITLNTEKFIGKLIRKSMQYFCIIQRVHMCIIYMQENLL